MSDTDTPNDLSSNLLETGLSRAFNALLALDPDSAARLTKLEGHRVRLALRKPALNLDLAIHNQLAQLRVRAQSDRPVPNADLEVKTTPAALMKLLMQGEAGVGQLRIEGDAELARWLSEALKNFRPDVDEWFSRSFGDVLGFQLARAARSGLAWMQETAQRVGEQGVSFLRDESRDVVSGSELAPFLDEVDELRDRVERAEYRLQRLLGSTA